MSDTEAKVALDPVDGELTDVARPLIQRLKSVGVCPRPLAFTRLSEAV
jgi:hypothetical protein